MAGPLWSHAVFAECVVLFLRVFLIVAVAAALAACASTPPSRRDAPAGPVIAHSLRLCPGVVIPNAPAADSARRIADYEPLARVNGASLYRAPVNACVSSGFGPRNGGASSYHHGVDLYTGEPATVVAGGDGVVEAARTMNGYGNMVLIRHSGGVKTRYAHLSSFAPGIRPGTRVMQGEPIGVTGATGNAKAVHLHYEIIVGGKARNPLNIGR